MYNNIYIHTYFYIRSLIFLIYFNNDFRTYVCMITTDLTRQQPHKLICNQKAAVSRRPTCVTPTYRARGVCALVVCSSGAEFIVGDQNSQIVGGGVYCVVNSQPKRILTNGKTGPSKPTWKNSLIFRTSRRMRQGTNTLLPGWETTS